MAGSRRPDSLSPPPGSCPVPPRTPGALGINDHGDPNITSLLGDTPSSVGWLDGGDPTLPQFSSSDPSRNLVCIDPTHTPLAIGFDRQKSKPAAASAPSQAVELDKAQEIALKITTYFEGGKSMNYQALADDFDGKGTSFGLIQWNFGSNTLGPLLKRMLGKNPAGFKSCFGTGSDYETIQKAISDGKQVDQLKWARDRIKNNRPAWKSAFTKIGSNEEFNKIQREQAAGQYHPRAVTVIKTLREISPDLFKNIALRSYAAIFDMCVQQGSITNAVKEIKKRVHDEKPASQLEVMKIVVVERARKASDKWVADCVSRRMSILTGASYKSTEHKITAVRQNPQLSLLTGSEGSYVSGL